MMESKEKWPPDDIYVYNSKGYMAYETGEDIAIDILLCSLHRDGKNPMEKYQNVYFETDTGIRYQSDLTSLLLYVLYYFPALHMQQFSLLIHKYCCRSMHSQRFHFC